LTREAQEKVMRIAVNGVELFFDVHGSGLAAQGNELVDKPVMVALHGGPSRSVTRRLC
jgi:hypothetical protein